MALRYSTNSIMEAVKGQIERAASDYIDHVYIYDGNLSTAIETHLSQGTLAKSKTFAFIAFSDESPILLSGSGMPLHTGIFIDINIVAIADGRTRYTSDLVRLYDAVDVIEQEAFCNDCSGLSQDYKDVIVRTEFNRRQRLDTGEAVLAHVVRIMVKPK